MEKFKFIILISNLFLCLCQLNKNDTLKILEDDKNITSNLN